MSVTNSIRELEISGMAVLKYCDIISEFREKFLAPSEMIEDIRPCMEPHHDRFIPLAIVVKFSDGSKIIYQHSSAKGDDICE